MQIVVRNGTLTEAEQGRYAKHVTEHIPVGLIEKIILDVREDGVAVSCELRRVRELRKMGGEVIGCPEDWNAAKQAEQRDTLPNPIDCRLTDCKNGSHSHLLI